jgi:hypothetical protein
MPEGFVTYYELEQFCEESDFLGKMGLLGEDQGIRLQPLATRIQRHGALEVTTGIVITFREIDGQIHVARLELETMEFWDLQRSQREGQMLRAELALNALRSHMAERLPRITRFPGGIHLQPGMMGSIRELNTRHSLFAIVADRSGDPHSPRSFKLNIAP